MINTRVNAVAPLFESGMIWAPDEEFAHEVIEGVLLFRMEIMTIWLTQLHKRS